MRSACDCMRASVKRFVLSPPARAPAAPSCRGHTGAPQACLGTPPRTALRRRLVSILHPGRACAAGSSRSASRVESSAWAPALGSHCGLRGRLRHRRAARSEPIVHCRWFHAPRLPVPLARAASSASRVPSAWRPSRPRAAPPPPCTLAHASASASADRLSWATSRLQLGANLAADRTGRVFGVVSPVRVPCAVCCATRCGRTLLDFGAVPPRIDLE